MPRSRSQVVPSRGIELLAAIFLKCARAGTSRAAPLSLFLPIHTHISPPHKSRHNGRGENDKNGKALAGCCVNGISETHRVLPFCVFPLSLSVCLCAGVSQRESRAAQSPLASLGALWLSPARSLGLECLVPAGALPPLPRLLPLHFSLSPPPSFPPSPLPCDSLWAVQKPHALFIYFPRWRAGDALRGAGA